MFSHSILVCAAVATVLTPVLQPDLATFRVFLRDGRVLNSHGECATLPEELVCLVKLGDGKVGETHDVLTVPLPLVDAEKTAEYARSLRAAQYGATRGDREYAELTTEISRALAELEAQTDRDKRLAIAQGMRQRLASWSADHFGYKADETRQLVGMLDEVIGELRIAAGQTKFSLDFVAGVAPTAAPTLLPAPDREQTLVAALDAAAVSPVAAERLDLLRSVNKVAAASADVSPALKARAASALRAEETTERQYRALMQDVIARADVNVRHGRASSMQRLIWEVEATDQKLGAKRPREMAAFVRRLEIELQLAKDQHAAYLRWDQVKEQLLAYELRTRGIFTRWVGQRAVLREVREGRTPGPAEVAEGLRAFAAIEQQLAALRPLPELQHVHGLLRSAAQMARQGLVLAERLTVASNDEIARNAAAAIAGSELLLAQGRKDFVPALNPRKVR